MLSKSTQMFPILPTLPFGYTQGYGIYYTL